MTAATLPLLAATDLTLPLAWRQGQPISAALFIAEAQDLAERLPSSGRPINLCQDRYHFALGLAAALLRRQTSLLPPNALADTLRQVPGAGAPPYLLADDPAQAAGGLPLIHVQRPSGRAAVGGPGAVPMVAADLDAVCLLTSGSTGAPQPHAKRWGALVANIRAEAERLAQHLGRPTLAGLTLVATVPPQHSYGLESSVLLALLGGACFDACRPFFPADIAQQLAAVPQPRALVTTPFHLKTLLLAGVALPAVELVLSATAPLSPQLAAQAEAAFGGQLIEIYGCTEAGQVASRRTTAGDTWTTLGDLRLTREVSGGDGGNGSDGSDGSDGADEQFTVAGGHVGQPTPLADVLDLADDRHFRLLGRANDLIHVAGKRSSLAHLNFHLNRIDGVDDGAFWLPDARDVPDTMAGAVVRPLALVVAPRLSARQVIAALRGQLEAAFVPRRVLFVNALPREATGKLTAAALRRFALLQLQRNGNNSNSKSKSQGPCHGNACGNGSAGATAGAAAPPAQDRVFDIAPDHPAFAGHFPGRPLLPGVVLLSLVMQAVDGHGPLRHRLGPQPRIDNAKFLAPVAPGSQVRVALREHGSTAVAFEVWTGQTVAARGQLSAAVVDASGVTAP